MGRFGNQLFQVAATIGYSRQYSMLYVLPNWEYTSIFKYGFNNNGVADNFPIYKEKAFRYTRIPKYSKIDLFGYFQSIKYWKNCEEEIRKLFTPNDEIKTRLDNFKDILQQSTCAVHVRRTDYLTLPDHHNNLTIEYYNEAMKEMDAQVYIIFSDDIEWCKENIKGENIIYMKSTNDIIDFFIMAQCKDFIIANSSYSWWASYLSDNTTKRIIAPAKNKWFGASYSQNQVDDLYLPSWKLI